MPEVTSLYAHVGRKMRVAGFMSGSGTNLRKILEYERSEDRGYQVKVIFSDNAESKAPEIGRDFDVPVIVRDIKGFYTVHGKPLNDLGARRAFDTRTTSWLRNEEIDCIALAGYMSIITTPLINGFLGVNVHPADLSIMQDGKRKYTGDNAVRDALSAGEREIRATTHLVTRRVDQGPLLMISSPVQVIQPVFDDVLDTMAKAYQDKLKEVGDWQIFPKTLELIADGSFQQDTQGTLHFVGKPVPQGVRL